MKTINISVKEKPPGQKYVKYTPEERFQILNLIKDLIADGIPRETIPSLLRFKYELKAPNGIDRATSIHVHTLLNTQEIKRFTPRGGAKPDKKESERDEMTRAILISKMPSNLKIKNLEYYWGI